MTYARQNSSYSTGYSVAQDAVPARYEKVCEDSWVQQHRHAALRVCVAQDAVPARV